MKTFMYIYFESKHINKKASVLGMLGLFYFEDNAVLTRDSRAAEEECKGMGSSMIF